MNYIDLLLFLVMLLSVWAGVQRGFILSFLQLASWIGSLLAGFVLYQPLAQVLLKLFPAIGIWAAPLSFIFIVVIARLVIDTLSYRLLAIIPRSYKASVINKALGAIPGAVNGFIWVAILATFLLLLPFTNTVSQKARESKLAGGLVDKVSWLEGKLSPVFRDVVNRSSVTIEPDPNKAVKLPYTTTHAKRRADLELQMLWLINKERRNNGLDTLKADPQMAGVARKHSADMFARGYFSHYSPEGTNPFDRMKKDHVTFIIAGENLALAPTLTVAHNGLMKSPGHRANILKPEFGRVGIGILDGGVYGLMITQDFRN